MKRERWLIIIVLCLTALSGAGIYIYNSLQLPPEAKSNIIQQNQSDRLLENLDTPLEPNSHRLFSLPTATNSQNPAESIKSPWESHLYGIVLKGTAGSNMAVIQNRDGSNERIVHIGDSIGKAKVHKISRNSLEIDGPLGPDTLELPTSRAMAVETSGKPDLSVTRSGDITYVQRKLLQDMLSQLDRLSEEITLQPVRHADGTPGGFRISALKPQGLLAQMGLRRHDMLTTVNQQRIVSVEDVYRVLEGATHQKTLHINILRNNQKMELNYVLQ